MINPKSNLDFNFRVKCELKLHLQLFGSHFRKSIGVVSAWMFISDKCRDMPLEKVLCFPVFFIVV